MFEPVVVGVDPGTASVGVAVVRGPSRSARIERTLTIRTAPDVAAAERLLRIHDQVAAILEEHHPDALAVERLMWGRNTDSAMNVARASGAILLAAARADVRVEEYAPLEVKMAVTGLGNASKEQVRRSLTRVLGLEGVPTQPDAADAVAVALCHLQQAKLRALVG